MLAAEIVIQRDPDGVRIMNQVRGHPGLLNGHRILIHITNTFEQEHIAACGDRQLLRHLIRAFHYPLVDPQGIRLFTAQYHLLRKAARLFQGIFEDVVNLRSVATGAGHDAFFFQRLHCLAHRNTRNAGQLAEIALAGQNVAMLKNPAANGIFDRLGKLPVQRRVIHRCHSFIQLRDKPGMRLFHLSFSRPTSLGSVYYHYHHAWK